MNIELHFSQPEHAALYYLAQASGKDVTQYLHEIVRTRLTVEHEFAQPKLSEFEEWQQRLDACIDRHPKSGRLDASRASIYADRP